MLEEGKKMGGEFEFVRRRKCWETVSRLNLLRLRRRKGSRE